jgi:putative glycerol-1-phosphate prenyltransferase
MVAEVSQKTQLPVIAGGGIRNAEMAEKIVKAGATAIVVGTLYETNPDEIVRIAEKIHSL